VRAEPTDPFGPLPEYTPPRPYTPTSSVLALPEGLPATVTAMLGPDTPNQDGVGEKRDRRQRIRGLEGGALLYGRRSRDGGPDVVSGIVIPEQIRNWGNYRIPREGIDAASAATRERGWVVLAQVHTHPGKNVEHSWFDDLNAISTKALSLVVPFYAADPGQWLDGVGTHVFQRDWWHLLTAEQARDRVVLVDAQLRTLDLRT
jgi:JAB domain-containing protein similar to deubiquitination enzymes